MVKGKYYENPFIAAFMDSMNNIPLPSRGYVITTRFREAGVALGIGGLTSAYISESAERRRALAELE